MTYLELPDLIKDGVSYQLVTAKDTPNFSEIADDVLKQGYAKFLFSPNPSIGQNINTFLCEVYQEFQYGLVESTTQRMVAVGFSVPLDWEGNFQNLPNEGWDWAYAKAMANHAEGSKPTVLCAMSITVLPEYRGKSLSRHMIKFMGEIAKFHKLGWLIVPARPTLKHLYPLTPIERYVNWQNEAGLPFDPWLRTHIKEGAKIIGICAKAFTIIDTITRWESRADMRFPETGDYIVPQALVPIKIDHARDRGTYIEPNVWLYYDLS
jgi:GNAT superfamily N-acetyltransferase